MPSKVFDLADRATDRRLAFLLKKWRAEGLSFEKVARRLDAEHGIDVSSVTVRKWLKAIENGWSEPEAAAS